MYEIKTYENEILVIYAEAWVDMTLTHYEGLDGQNYATLYGLRSNERRKGYASKVMDYVCNIADMYNIELHLSAWADDFSHNPPDLLTQDELVAFYKRKGFVFKEGTNYAERTPILKEINCDESIKLFFDRVKEYYLELDEQFS